MNGMLSRKVFNFKLISAFRQTQYGLNGNLQTKLAARRASTVSTIPDTHVEGVADDEGPQFQFTRTRFTDSLKFRGLETEPKFEVFRVMDRDADLLVPEKEVLMEHDLVKACYRKMVELRMLDEGLSTAVKNGEISLSVSCTGEEAVIIGTSAALDNNDTVFSQYREYGVLLWRGWPYERFVDQGLGNTDDVNKGRQMPVHYGSNDCNFITVSSPLATQLPQAVGWAYAQKRAGKSLVTACFLGESTTSAGDSHAGFNFAAVLDTPVVFICRNNGYAISAPVHEHYRGDGIASRGPAYGLETVRVDGNDLFAVYEATKQAREIALSTNSPVLIETMSYRVADHTSLVDGENYRADEEIEYWKLHDNPINRVKNYLTKHMGWNEEVDEKLRKDIQNDIEEAFEKSRLKKLPNPELMFTDVYEELPKNLNRQLNFFKAHLKKHSGKYPAGRHEEVSHSLY